MCTNVLPVYMWVHWFHTWYLKKSEDEPDPLELEFLVFVSHCVDSENQTQIFWRTSALCHRTTIPAHHLTFSHYPDPPARNGAAYNVLIPTTSIIKQNNLWKTHSQGNLIEAIFQWGSLFPGTMKGNWHTWIPRTFNSSPHLLRQMLYQASHFTGPPLCFINQLFASS